MKLHRSDCIVARSRSFSCWQEIIDAVKERRLHIYKTLDERRVWRKIQNNVGMEE